MLTAPAKGETQAGKQTEPAGPRTRLTLRPGQAGTKKLQQKYGERLLAVRYRYDAERQLRIKTVELVEEVLPWSGPAVLVRIGYDERELRCNIMAAGGKWLPENKLWEVPASAVAGLNLESRVVG